jgi:hypothetical protein
MRQNGAAPIVDMGKGRYVQDPVTGKMAGREGNDTSDEIELPSHPDDIDPLDYFDLMTFSGDRRFARIAELSVGLGYNNVDLQEIATEVCGTCDWNRITDAELDEIVEVFEQAWDESGGDTASILMREIDEITAQMAEIPYVDNDADPDPFAAGPKQ